MNTWQNLERFDNSTVWMTDSSTDVWNGINSPPFRDDWDLCNLNGCTGAWVWVSGMHGSLGLGYWRARELGSGLAACTGAWVCVSGVHGSLGLC